MGRKCVVCTICIGIVSLMLCACNKGKWVVDYPENPLRIETHIFYDPNDIEDGYMAFDYNGRTYIMYAHLKGTLRKEEMGQCIGCTLQDGREDQWIIRLNAFEDDDIMLLYYPDGFMEPMIFYRAVDTKGKDLDIPKYIDPNPDWRFWN